MKKYTVLLVDDEEIVIQVILKKIEWDNLGFTVIGHANNGVKGLEMAQEFAPDVVLTDIKMPYLDGMEMSKRIKKNFPDTKIVIFTGFDEFEYAKEAIHLEVEEYLLKPINSFELTEVLKKIKDKLDQAISERKNIETLKEYYEQSLPLLRENFLVSMVQGKLHKNEIQKYASDYKIELNSPFYCCSVIHTSKTENASDMDHVLLNASVHKEIKGKLSEKWRVVYFSYLENMNMIIQMEDQNQIMEFTDECNRFCNYIYRVIGAVVTIGIGKVCTDLSELEESYIGARKAVSYRVLYGASQAIYIKEIVPKEHTKEEKNEKSELDSLFKTIYFNSKDEIQKAVDYYFEYVLLPEKSLQKYQIHVMELISAIYRFIWNNGIELDGTYDNMSELYHMLLEMAPDSLRNWMKKISVTLSEKLVNARENNRKSYVTNAIEYVHSNYSDEDLSLDSVCEVLAVSNSYFSSVFKKETGKSFIEYLTDYRMQIASTMLLETKDKSYVIAEKVGYADANYFSYVFKKSFGVSPSIYRTEYINAKK